MVTAGVATEWFEPIPAGNGIAGWTEPHVHLMLRANLWHVRGRDRDLIVDSGCGIARLRHARPELFANRPLLVCTHGHFDHVGGAAEFPDRAIHLHERNLLSAPEWATLRGSDFPGELWEEMARLGMPLRPVMIDALPVPGYDVDAYSIAAAPATRLLDEADVIDLGDRRFQVLHLPGHSPGSIGLFETETGVLFSGDAVYDGPLLDTLPGADIAAYRDTMMRLLELPVSIVHAGHDPSFGRKRLREIAERYLAWRGG